MIHSKDLCTRAEDAGAIHKWFHGQVTSWTLGAAFYAVGGVGDGSAHGTLVKQNTLIVNCRIIMLCCIDLQLEWRFFMDSPPFTADHSGFRVSKHGWGTGCQRLSRSWGCQVDLDAGHTSWRVCWDGANVLSGAQVLSLNVEMEVS